MLDRLKTLLMKKPDQPAASVDWDAFVEQSIKEDAARKKTTEAENPKREKAVDWLDTIACASIAASEKGKERPTTAPASITPPPRKSWFWTTAKNLVIATFFLPFVMCAGCFGFFVAGVVTADREEDEPIVHKPLPVVAEVAPVTPTPSSAVRPEPPKVANAPIQIRLPSDKVEPPVQIEQPGPDRPGYYWVSGGYAQGKWHSGYWKEKPFDPTRPFVDVENEAVANRFDPTQSRPRRTSTPAYSSDRESSSYTPSNAGKVWVSGYTRKDGTQVKGHWRSK